MENFTPPPRTNTHLSLVHFSGWIATPDPPIVLQLCLFSLQPPPTVSLLPFSVKISELCNCCHYLLRYLNLLCRLCVEEGDPVIINEISRHKVRVARVHIDLGYMLFTMLEIIVSEIYRI